MRSCPRLRRAHAQRMCPPLAPRSHPFLFVTDSFLFVCAVHGVPAREGAPAAAVGGCRSFLGGCWVHGHGRMLPSRCVALRYAAPAGCLPALLALIHMHGGRSQALTPPPCRCPGALRGCSTNTIGAVARIRNALAYATHKFFQARRSLTACLCRSWRWLHAARAAARASALPPCAHGARIGPTAPRSCRRRTPRPAHVALPWLRTAASCTCTPPSSPPPTARARARCSRFAGRLCGVRGACVGCVARGWAGEQALRGTDEPPRSAAGRVPLPSAQRCSPLAALPPIRCTAHGSCRASPLPSLPGHHAAVQG